MGKAANKLAGMDLNKSGAAGGRGVLSSMQMR
jgi:hypothetical protein